MGYGQFGPHATPGIEHEREPRPSSGSDRYWAAVNVMPWSMGQLLGCDWDSSTPVTLSGNLATAEARIVIVDAVIGPFPAIRLAFAWSQLNTVPLLLGQVNFLLQFDVYLSRSGNWFEVILP